ncbi:MAG: signal peptidase II [Oscillospiraceae bacterium]|nr:signal peptidase II [Oscillospiraceae bacterium]
MLYAIVAVIAIIFDQLLKYWVTANIVLDTGEKALIPGVIHLTRVHNSGAAFSFMEGSAVARWFFVVLCVAVVAVIVLMLVRNTITGRVTRWCAVFVAAGSVGNCIDRLLNGYVVDMLEFEFFSFPVFNIADIFITVGCIAFCVGLLLEHAPAGKSAEKSAESRKSAKSVKPAKSTKGRAAAPYFEQPAAEVRSDDPFAEWEHVAAPTKRPSAAPAAPAETPPAAKPAAAQAAKPAPVQAPKPAPAAPSPKPTPAAAEPEIKLTAEPQSAKTQSSGDEYSLEDILAEFRDI